MARLTDLTAATLKGLQKVTTAQEAVALAKFSVTLKCTPSFLKVWHRENKYTVGNWDAWDGEYWVVEDSTGIIHRGGSVSDLKDWIKLCSAVAHGERFTVGHPKGALWEQLTGDTTCALKQQQSLRLSMRLQVATQGFG